MATPLLPDKNFAENEVVAEEKSQAQLSSAPISEEKNYFVHALIIGTALFIMLLLLVLGIYFGKTLPGAWFPKNDILNWGAAEIQLVRGVLIADQSNAEQRAFQTDEAGMAVLALNPRFSAAQYPVIDFDVASLPEGTAARLMWRNDFRPNERAMADIDVVDGRLQPITMAGHNAWISQIFGLALVVQTSGRQEFLVRAISAHPMGLDESLSRLLGNWLGFSPWTGTAIAQLDDVQPPLSFFIAALLLLPMLVGAAIFFWRQHRHAPHQIPAKNIQWQRVGLVLFVLGWLTLDARWLWQLTQQTEQIRSIYGGKGVVEKHLAAVDAPLYAFIDKVRLLLPKNTTRIFALAPDPYLRSRIAYLLAPYNVYFDFYQAAPSGGHMLRRGDYVLAFRQSGIQYDAAKKKMRWPDGTEITAEIKIWEAGSALIEIL